MIFDDVEIRPCHDLVLLERLDDLGLSPGGIAIPESAQENNAPRWRVLAVGRGRPNGQGGFVEPDCTVGDIVLLSPARGQMFEVPGRRRRTLLADAAAVAAIIGRDAVQ